MHSHMHAHLLDIRIVANKQPLLIPHTSLGSAATNALLALQQLALRTMIDVRLQSIMHRSIE